MSESEQLRYAAERLLDLETEPELRALLDARIGRGFIDIGVDSGREEMDAPFDLRVMRPRAVDLRRLWDITGQPVPPGIDAALGPRIPILLNHVVTPFPLDGRLPGGVWGLGYEFVAEDLEGNTVEVIPSDESLKIAEVGQSVELGLDLGGGIQVPAEALGVFEEAAAIQLTGASVRASTAQNVQFSVKLLISLRKVVGGPVGAGGAKWQMYRQDEPLDRPHALLQTLLVEEGTTEIRCTLRTWAKQAGWLGTRLGAKFWEYPDQPFTISLT